MIDPNAHIICVFFEAYADKNNCSLEYERREFSIPITTLLEAEKIVKRQRNIWTLLVEVFVNISKYASERWAFVEMYYNHDGIYSIFQTLVTKNFFTYSTKIDITTLMTESSERPYYIILAVDRDAVDEAENKMLTEWFSDEIRAKLNKQIENYFKEEDEYDNG